MIIVLMYNILDFNKRWEFYKVRWTSNISNLITYISFRVLYSRRCIIVFTRAESLKTNGVTCLNNFAPRLTRWRPIPSPTRIFGNESNMFFLQQTTSWFANVILTRETRFNNWTLTDAIFVSLISASLLSFSLAFTSPFLVSWMS